MSKRRKADASIGLSESNETYRQSKDAYAARLPDGGAALRKQARDAAASRSTATDIWGSPVVPPSRGILSDRFDIPPFSVFNAREGWWQARKGKWIGLGIQSELGRGDDSSPGGSPRPACKLDDEGRTKRGDGAGREIPFTPTKRADARSFNIGLGANKDNGWAVEDGKGSGTSIFDPVLCELAYKWFSPEGGTILDPFAGGSVRGIVADVLGRSYVGIDLQGRQLEANREQAARICEGEGPTWIEGDSARVRKLCKGLEADFVFSCPPYGDLELYSHDPADLSNMSYEDFLVSYRKIIRRTCKLLRDDRFACFVVGDFRDKKTGVYRNFVSQTIEAFEDAGLGLYNEAILITAVGSLAIRAGKQFVASRKLGKTHQNVLVFLKGDAKRATKSLPVFETLLG